MPYFLGLVWLRLGVGYVCIIGQEQRALHRFTCAVPLYPGIRTCRSGFFGPGDRRVNIKLICRSVQRSSTHSLGVIRWFVCFFLVLLWHPFVYRDGTGWPASLPYIRKIRISVAIVNPESIFTKGYLWSKYGGPQKMTKIR